MLKIPHAGGEVGRQRFQETFLRVPFNKAPRWLRAANVISQECFKSSVESLREPISAHERDAQNLDDNVSSQGRRHTCQCGLPATLGRMKLGGIIFEPELIEGGGIRRHDNDRALRHPPMVNGEHG
jgi:hypothetical protein